MRYVDAFRDPRAAGALVERIRAAAARLPSGRTWNIMEVCGSHTMAIARFGIRGLLPPNLALLSGPGCPVCVTPAGYIDAAIRLAEAGHIIVTFGDLVAVPGTRSSLREARAQGADVRPAYSPLAALEIAAANPGREVVFLAIGFETTIGPVISLVERAGQQGLKNLSLLTSFKLVPPALLALRNLPGLRVDAFLCPAHVSAVIGPHAYEPFAGSGGVPCVIAGFEPLDILFGLTEIANQLAAGEARVVNQYARVVRADGNPRIRALFDAYLQPVDARWRGIGVIPASGLGLRPAYRHVDAAARFGINTEAGEEPAGCMCGSVITGRCAPPDCPLFGRTCTPDHPVGPCMVSSEGSCSAFFKYGVEA